MPCSSWRPAPTVTASHGLTLQRSTIPWNKAWDDIEDLTSDGSTVFAIGSHGVNSSSLLRNDRQRLLRIRGDAAPEPFSGLVPALLRLPDTEMRALGLTRSAAAAQEGERSEPIVAGLNIEGLALVPQSATHDLLIGLRSPLAPASGLHQAIVLRLNDVDRLFDEPGAAEARVEKYRTLDLGGRGIAALTYDPLSHAYLVAASPATEGDPFDYSSLWLWDPTNDVRPTRPLMRFPGHKLEGVARVAWNGRNAIVFTFDEERWVHHKSGAVRRQYGRVVVVEHGSFQ